MDPLTLPLAAGCLVRFAGIDPVFTDRFGDRETGIVYRVVSVVDARGQMRVIEAGAAGEGFSPGGLWDVGASPDGLFLSYIAIAQGASATSNDIRFVSAARCGTVRFVRARDRAAIGAGRYAGWDPAAGHTVRIQKNARETEPALPENEVPGAR